MRSLSIAALLVLAVAATLLVSTCAANYITFSNCTDKALCASGCVSAQLAANTCQTEQPHKSQIIMCSKKLGLCGDLFYYSDSACKNLIMTNAFVCGTCNKNSDNDDHNRVQCMIENDRQYMAIDICGPTGCGGNCVQYMNYTAGQCTPQKVNSGMLQGPGAKHVDLKEGQVVYSKYVGATACGTLELEQWSNRVDCTGPCQNRPVLPQDRCINGIKVSCTFDE